MIGPGIDTLRSLPPEEQFDFAFIDADKTGYPAYYEEILSRLRPGGLVLLDNTLQGGRVLDPANDDESVSAIRALNDSGGRRRTGESGPVADRRRRQRGAEDLTRSSSASAWPRAQR